MSLEITTNIIKEIIKKDIIKLKIKASMPENKFKSYDKEKNILFLEIKAPPINGKANTEIIKFLNKNTKKKTQIISGKKSKIKLIKIS
jgi:uncharacterized protein